MQHELEEARESLAFWERRLAGLPRRARAPRREAEDHVRRCRARVAELERQAFGAGARGALAQLAAEGRLPEPARHRARDLRRRGRRAVVVGGVIVAGTIAVLAVVALLVVLAVLGAL